PVFPLRFGRNALSAAKHPLQLADQLRHHSCSQASIRRVRQLATYSLELRTHFCYRPDLNDRAMWEGRTSFSDLECFIEVRHLDQKVPANGFFRFSKGPICNCLAFLLRNDATLRNQRVRRFYFALVDQLVVPGSPFAHYLLKLFRGEFCVPIVPAEQQPRYIWATNRPARSRTNFL